MQQGNLFSPPASALTSEWFEELLVGNRCRLERIVSTGQATPTGEWLDEPQREWVVLLAGAARLRFADEGEPRQLQPGDWLDIAPHRRHRVDWTDPRQTTVWLALHLGESTGPSTSAIPRDRPDT